MSDAIIKIENVVKQYRLGLIGGGTLQGDLQSWWARVRGKEDPNMKIGAKVYKKNERFLALDGINLEVKKGERVGIIGHNGAGKSTLLKLLSRVTAPTEGEIYLDGRISSMLEVGTGFHGELTGRENIYLNGAILGMTREEVTAKIDKIIEFSECGQFIDTPVKRYSSGMYVKLAFSVAAHLDSEILIMDEVLAVGDMAFQQKCINKMSEVSKEEGRTILYVSHNMNTIRQLCDRCVVLSHGTVIFDGDVEEAIQIYMSNNNMTLSAFQDFTNFVRPKYSHDLARIESLEFLGKEESIYKHDEDIKIELKWKSNKELKDVRLRILLAQHDGTPIGVAASVPLADTKGNEEVCSRLLVQFPNVVEGKYILTLSLYQSNELGGSIIIDTLPGACMLQFLNGKDENNILNWPSKAWGSVRFPDISLLEN